MAATGVLADTGTESGVPAGSPVTELHRVAPGCDLEDPEFLKEYVTEFLRIGTIDAIINALDEARQLEGLSKGDLARAIGSEPATIRRLLTARTPNPTIGTVIEVAAAVGLRITLERMPEEEQRAVTQPLRTGRPTAELKRRFVQERASRAKAKA